MGVEICFDGYLRSLVSAYQQWWRLYTLTDATGRESQRVERDRIAPAFFDFGLMVQTVDKEKVESQKASAVSVSRTEKEEGEKEKIERLPVLEGICKYAAEHVLLVGRPGSGKSTALARLLLQEAENALSDRNAKIPVLVELRYLPSEANESSVCDRIVAFMHKYDPALDIDEAGIKQLLRQGRLLLLVDGVNELPSDRGRVMVNQFRELYQNTCPMIFTTRELSTGGDLGIAKRLEMQPLTEPQMRQFVIKYLEGHGEKLLRQLSGRLREFGQTPLLLWMLCWIFTPSQQIPPNLGMVFRDFIEKIYTTKIKGSITTYKNSQIWWGRLLQCLAFEMISGENLTDSRVAISRQRAERILVEFLKGKVEYPDDCAIRWLNDLLNHHLIQVSNDLIEFEHQLIQEYYAAEWLWGLLENQQISYERLQHDYLNYLKWTEPLALMLELVEGEEQAVRVVRLALEVDLRLGARLAGAVKYGFQEKTVGLLLREIEERKIPKLYAIDLLGETRSDVVTKTLIHNLKSTNNDMSGRAADALVKIGSDKVIKYLIECLKESNNDISSKAANVLVRIDSDKSIEPLINHLKKLNRYVSEKMAKVLGQIQNTHAVESLILILKEAPYSVRRYAIEALGNIGIDKSVEPLILILRGSNKGLRVKASEALGKIGSHKAVEPLIQALMDVDDSIRVKAAEALGNIGSDKAVEPLIHVLNNSSKDLYRYSAEALGKIGSDKAVEPLIYALNNLNMKQRIDLNRHVRRSAAKALGRIGGDRVVTLLIEVLTDSNYLLSMLAADALGQIGCNKAVDSLIQSLNCSNYLVRTYAIEALGNIGDDRAVEPLIQTLSNPKVNRVKTIIALGKIGNNKAVEFLIQALINSPNNSRERAPTMIALGKIGNNKAVEPLIQALNNPSTSGRGSAAVALGMIGNQKAVKHLIQSLSDLNAGIRKGAVSGLGYIGSEQVVEPLIQALKDLDDDVCKSAAYLLMQICKNDCNLPILAQQLPHLLTLISTESSQQALSVITAIQARCKYYNYDIAQTPLQEEDNNDKVLSNPQGNIIQMTEIKNDFSNANFGAANIANLGGTVNEQKIVQKTEVPKQSLAEATKEIQELLAQLNLNTPATNKAEEQTLVTRIIQAIQKVPNLRDMFLAGGIELVKIICPPLGIPIEMSKKLLEAAEKEKQV